MSTASAPGKIILFGEHAVVYGYPALAVPVTQVSAEVTVTSSSQTGIRLEAPDIYLSANFAELPATHPLKVAITGVVQALHVSANLDLTIKIKSSIPVASGLGSGAAVSVALMRALSAHLGSLLPDDQVNDLCYGIEKIHHGTPSGIDNTVVTYARPVYFIKNRPIETFQVKTPFSMVIADTGTSAPTKESVGDVRKLWLANPTHWDGVFAQVAEIVQEARAAIENGNWQRLGPLMDANHALLQEMSVSSPELDRLVVAARSAGALGAKLSGGGRGGNMLALAQPETAGQIASALLAAGAKKTIVTTVQ